MTIKISYKYFKTSPEIIQLAVMYYVRYPLSLRAPYTNHTSWQGLGSSRLVFFFKVRSELAYGSGVFSALTAHCRRSCVAQLKSA
jgi:hypothetical protein